MNAPDMPSQCPGPSQRWEHGSELHALWPDPLSGPRPAAELAGPNLARLGHRPWLLHEPRYYGSGRDALRAIVRHGHLAHGWQRLWCPAYFCPEVLDALTRETPSIQLYPDDPRWPQVQWSGLGPRLMPGDAVLVVNTFGLRGPARSCDIPPGIALIEDHSHDLLSPWARTSQANYAVASFRKTLPIPDGAVVWSPLGEDLPAPYAVTRERLQASRHKWKAMQDKAAYLRGEDVDKPAYRQLSAEGERHIATGDISGMTTHARNLLEDMPLNTWRERRAENHALFAQMLQNLLCACDDDDTAPAPPELPTILAPAHAEGTPYALMLLFTKADQRDAVRQYLMRNHIYTAVLWDLGAWSRHRQMPPALVDLSRRLLCLHGDMRYEAVDMWRVAQTLVQALRQAPAG